MEAAARMKVLLTGATGLVGRDLAFAAAKGGFELLSAQHACPPECGKPVLLDLSSSDSIRKAFAANRPDVVVHAAAWTDVEGCESNKELALAVNAKATEAIAIEAKRTGSHLVYVSTDYVFDGSKGAYDENDEPNPVNFYGRSKLMGEVAVERFAPTWCIARTSTPYGLHPRRKSFPVVVAERLSACEEMKVVSDQRTSPTHTANLSMMILELVARRSEGTVHVSSSTGISRLEFAARVAKELELDGSLLRPARGEEVGWRAVRPRDTTLNVSKANSLLAAKPESLEESLRAFIPSLKRQEMHARTRTDK
ncbi:MAG: dTDP-4-dehydrorhamnose reductase [Nitrososphaerota archaeon]|nr:dTDP-4-dehydrorhamnose reductase [Nitrososphaerota archaeon]